MIQARCLQRSGHRFINTSFALTSSPRPGRNFYSAFAANTSSHDLAKNLLVRPPHPWKLRQWPPQRFSGNCALRFASTNPNPPPVAEVQSDYVPPPDPAGEFLPTSLDEMISSIPPPVYDHLGFLKEMGLDYGWGPTALVETLLEHVHVYLGTPWWASIGISLLIIRAAMFKFYVDAADSSTRRQLVKHLDEPILARVQAARAAKDQMAMREAWSERTALNKSAGIIWWKPFVPLLQIPIGYGTFRLIRGMAALPVPGFDTGGLLWVTDLTLSDPYFVLPIATAVAYYFAFKRGGEIGNSDLIGETSRKICLYVIPPLSAFIMQWWPGGLQLTFFITASIATLQAELFRTPWFRNLVGIQPLPQLAAPRTYSGTESRYQARSSRTSTPPPKGVFGNIKGAVSYVTKLGEKAAPMPRQQASKDRLTDAEKKYAKTYEQKRAREIAREAEMKRVLAQEKFERQQDQEMKEQERKERLQRRAEKKARQM